MRAHQQAGWGQVRRERLRFVELFPFTSQEKSAAYRHEQNCDRFGYGRHGRFIAAIAAQVFRKQERSGRGKRRTGGRHFAETGTIPGAGIFESIKPVHVRERDTHCQDKDDNANNPGGERRSFSIACHRRSFPRGRTLTRQTRKQGSCRFSAQQLNFVTQYIAIC